MHGPPAGPIVPARQRQSASELLSWQVKCACALTSPATQSTRAHIYFREKSLWRIRPNKWAEWTKSICTQTIGRKHRWAGQTVRNFSIYILISKNTLWWVKMWWVVGKFFDVTKMRVNLFHFCLKWVKIDIRFDTHENNFCFTHLQISPTHRIHQLSDFTQFHLTILSPHSLVGSAGFLPKSIVPTIADFTNLQISPTFRFHPVTTCRFHLLVDFT